MPSPYSPPPVDLPGGGLAVPVDVTAVRATLTFDVAARQGWGEARVTFVVDEPGHPVLDLRQPPDEVRLDGVSRPGDAFPRCDLGAGPEEGMRVLDAEVEPGRHTLEVTYPLAVPDAAGAQGPEWTDGGVRFDLWMSDLAAGRYLESWVPANLCHDRFALTVDLVLAGTRRRHAVVANGTVVDGGAGRRFRVGYPEQFTCLSPMLVLAPADELETRRRSLSLPGRTLTLTVTRPHDVDTDVAACEADIAAWLPFLAARYGPWAHGERFDAFLWGPGRGMEYDGATTAHTDALEHEVFHSWFGRGVKPASASDGWIDEAFTSWATASRRREGARFAAEPLDLDADPVELYPAHPWSRHTPVASYSVGAAVFADLAHRLGGAAPLRSAMADWYGANAGELVTTAGLAEHLAAWSGVDVEPVFERFVYGRG